MRQLVGLTCVLCRKSIGSIVDGRFCDSCRCPVHVRCTDAVRDSGQAKSCSACGATHEDIAQEKAHHREDEQQRKIARDGAGLPTTAWTVLVASSRRFCSPVATRLSHDRGSLEWERGEICVIGRQVHEFTDVTGLLLVRQRLPWIAAIVANILMLGIMVVAIASHQMVPTNPLPWLVVAGLNLLLVAPAVSTKWLRVTYRNKAGLAEDVYLLPVTSGGWRSFDGGVLRLHAILTEEVLNSTSEKMQ
jgi:hypothetical protein